MIGPGLHRLIHFQKISENDLVNETTFAEIVRELTGDWVIEIDCDSIQGKNRFYYDEIVYFGNKEELKKDGAVEAFAEASMYDRFTFDEQRVGHFYNTDPECRRLRDLDPETNYLIIYNGEGSLPFVLTIGKDNIDLNRIIYETTVGVVRGTPRWTQRAKQAVFDLKMNGLIYMHPNEEKPQDNLL